MVKTVLESNSRRNEFYFLSVVDSGADHCIFPASFGKQLGLDIEKGQPMDGAGVGGGDTWFYHNVRIWVEIDQRAWGFDCLTGFSFKMDALGIGLLGRDGFFHLFEEVTFDQNNRLFKFKVPGEKPSEHNPISSQ
jgi:hypothetical protein